MLFATDLSTSSGQTVTNDGSLTSQFSAKMGYSNGVLSVKSISLETGSITSTKRRKRQLRRLRAAVSCNSTQASSGVSQGDNLRIIITINECPKTKCKTTYCFTQCVPEIKADIQSKLGSTSFTIVTNLGSYAVSCQFCAFNQVVSDLFSERETFRLGLTTTTSTISRTSSTTTTTTSITTSTTTTTARPTCTDSVKNQDETGVDCGGSICSTKCAAGLTCRANSDCVSAVCTSGVCQAATCFDKVKDTDETDVDCGGSCPNQCATGQACGGDADCVGEVCTSSICQPSCYDNVKNQDETGVDCGGSICSTKCAAGQTCAGTSDCVSNVCTGGICQAATCTDTVKNQDETDVDCGGNICSRCAIGHVCRIASDCVGGVCTSSMCQPSCYDNIKNQDETDVDCGGSTCSTKCVTGQACGGAADCENRICTTLQACSVTCCSGGSGYGGSGTFIAGVVPATYTGVGTCTPCTYLDNPVYCIGGPTTPYGSGYPYIGPGFFTFNFYGNGCFPNDSPPYFSGGRGCTSG
ncbi:unnamed protein product [Adineta steineri]|uniref:Uncharacterized protein n=1 Tax=Adineta steineri TaxID=433720 RepID=A0A815K8R0_9BILA|nr:unnamed protein product [Adineta steineri]